MKISRTEIEVVDSESNTGSNSSSSSSSSFNYPTKNNSNIDLEKLDINNNIDYLDSYVYNNFWTLRKCSSKLLDKISCKYPKSTLFIIKPFLENDLQCEDWIKKYIFDYKNFQGKINPRIRSHRGWKLRIP